MKDIKLPDGWKKCRFDEVFTITIGGTPSRKVEEYWGGEYNWVAISDLVSKYISKTKEKITEEAIKKSNVKLIPKGSVILSFKLSIGKVAISAVDLFTNEAIAALIPKDNNIFIPEYVYYFLKNTDLTCYGQKAVKGVCLNKSILRDVKIIVPPLETQKKIAEVLEKAEKVIEKRKETIKLLDELVKSKFIEMFGDPINNPMGWEKKRLVDECNIVTGNTPSRKIEEYYGDYIEWIKSDNITGSSIYLTKAREYLSEKGLEVGRSIGENSILMTCIAGSVKCIGNVAIANRKVAFNQQINGIEPLKNNVLFMFEQFNLSQKYIQSTINMSLKGILSKGQLSQLEFIFPPIELQNQFADFVNQVDKVKFEMEKSLKELEDNFNSLMQRAFKGELF